MRRFDGIVEAVYGHLTKVHGIKDVRVAYGGKKVFVWIGNPQDVYFVRQMLEGGWRGLYIDVMPLAGVGPQEKS
jgi:hypothetical protein